MRGITGMIALSALLGAGTAQADLLGVTVGAGGWSQDPGGWVQYKSNDQFDVDDDLNMDKETGGYIFAKIEHPIPVLPNVRLYYGQSSFKGTGTVDRTRSFGNITVIANEKVKSEANLDYVDGTFYYQLLDNVVSLDLGLNVRYMSGHVKVTRVATGESEEANIDFAFPMGYAMARVDIPTTGIFLKAEGSAIGYNGNRIVDAQIGAGYELGLVAANLGVEAGYKSQQIKLDDVDNASADVSVKGPYAGVYVDF